MFRVISRCPLRWSITLYKQTPRIDPASLAGQKMAPPTRAPSRHCPLLELVGAEELLDACLDLLLRLWRHHLLLCDLLEDLGLVAPHEVEPEALEAEDLLLRD